MLLIEQIFSIPKEGLMALQSIGADSALTLQRDKPFNKNFCFGLFDVRMLGRVDDNNAVRIE